MTLDLNSLSFGQYLKTIRLQNGVELEVIAKETRIGMDNLRHIENEAHDLLPAAAFVKGFLRAYAQALGVDPEDVVRRYEESSRSERMHAQAEADLVQLNQRFWPRLLLSLGTLGVLMALSIMLVSLSDKPLTPTEKDRPAVEASTPTSRTSVNDPSAAPTLARPTEPNQVVETLPPAVKPSQELLEEREPGLPATTPSDQDSEAAMVEKAPDPIRLKILAQEETWLEINADESEANTYRLEAGAHLELEASSAFRLFVGNAGGITLWLNDSQLPPLGRSGQVVTVRLP